MTTNIHTSFPNVLVVSQTDCITFQSHCDVKVSVTTLNVRSCVERRVYVVATY